MRVLYWYCDRIAWTPTLKTLPEFEDSPPGEVTGAVSAFVHVEPRDAECAGKVETKLVKNAKWLAGKWDTRRVVLHSFAHLAENKADPEFTRELLGNARQRLADAGYEVVETPFGYFNDLELSAPGHPLARVYKEF
jgi:hypothetical protein